MICIILYVCVYISCDFIGDPQLTNSNIKLLQCYSTFLTSLKSVQNNILVKFGKNHILQKPVHRFASQIIYWFLNKRSPHRKLFAKILWYGSNKDTPKTPQYSKTPLYSDHPQGHIRLALKMIRTPESFRKLKHNGLFENNPSIKNRTMYK